MVISCQWESYQRSSGQINANRRGLNAEGEFLSCQCSCPIGKVKSVLQLYWEFLKCAHLEMTIKFDSWKWHIFSFLFLSSNSGGVHYSYTTKKCLVVVIIFFKTMIHFLNLKREIVTFSPCRTKEWVHEIIRQGFYMLSPHMKLCQFKDSTSKLKRQNSLCFGSFKGGDRPSLGFIRIFNLGYDQLV